MSIPVFTELLLPALDAFSSGGDRTSAQVREAIATELKLSTADLTEPLPNSPQPKFTNRVHWAIFYLRKAGLLERIRRGVHRITPAGRDVAAKRPAMSVEYLATFPQFAAWQNAQTKPEPASSPGEALVVNEASPDEQLANAAATLRAHVEEELLSRIMERSPAFFERLVLQLLQQMGYGGVTGAAEHLGGSGDGGVDGVIREDKLGLDAIYFQAKRYDPSRPVPARDVRDFIGALEAARSKRGVFLTTASDFSPDSKQLVDRIEKRIALINGRRLVQLMFDHDLGVRTKSMFTVKEIDEDTFIEDV